jgi:hypothetical protein
MIQFDFTKIFESTNEAETFFRTMGVPVHEQDNPIRLLQVIAEYMESLRNKSREIRVSALNISKQAFKDITGEELLDVAAKYDPNKSVEEGEHDMMPRKKFHTDRSKALNMKSADEIMRTTMEGVWRTIGKVGKNTVNESVDPNSFEMTGPVSDKRYITKEELVGLSVGMPQEMLPNPAETEVFSDLIGGAFITDPNGNVEYSIADETTDDYALDETWFADATQDLVDRASTGECWTTIIHDLAQRFAGFFDGSYHAFDFAAAAFSRRAIEMGLMEQQMMVESFDKTGSFDNLEPILASTEYRGHTVSLHPHDHDGIKIFRLELKPTGNMVKYSQ